ncbi:hypothetical protein GCM10023405_22750 [Streptomonospora salina]
MLRERAAAEAAQDEYRPVDASQGAAAVGGPHRRRSAAGSFGTSRTDSLRSDDLADLESKPPPLKEFLLANRTAPARRSGIGGLRRLSRVSCPAVSTSRAAEGLHFAGHRERFFRIHGHQGGADDGARPDDAAPGRRPALIRCLRRGRLRRVPGTGTRSASFTAIRGHRDRQ